jgi:hypothetical protein
MRALRRRSAVALTALAPLVLLAACSSDFDTTRNPAPRGTLGAEVFGVFCDRVGAQALHEDLTGASYSGICHMTADAAYSSQVDLTQLPALVDGAPDQDGKPVPLAVQQATRAYGIARIQTLALHRSDLIAALDFSMPDIMVPTKDITNPDPTKTCDPPAASGERSYHDELSDLLGRLQALYDDNTIPYSTESLGAVMNAFKASQDATNAWAHFDARQGYRPVDVAFGALRPSIAYPQLRDLANASLSVISADSNPYAANPMFDPNGNRIPVPGPANGQFKALLAALRGELRDATADPVLTPLGAPTQDTSGRYVLSRPRSDLETMQSIFYAQDPAFGGGASEYIVARDSRGYAAVPLVGGAVPTPFVDMDHDGLADVDMLGQFVTSTGTPAPTPFLTVTSAAGNRDMYGRALDAQSMPIYGSLDTSHTYAASLLGDLGPLVNPDTTQNHETLMNALAGAYVLFGSRDTGATSSKTYSPDPDADTDWLLQNPGGTPPAGIATQATVLQYNAFHPATSPLLDLVYGAGQVFGDKSSDDTLSLTKQLFTTDLADVARLTGDGLYAKTQIADMHPEAKIPATSVLWDDLIDVIVQIAQVPGLLEDVMSALADPASAQLGQIFADYQNYNDRISYDRSNLNGPAYDFATSNNGEMSTVVTRSMPDTGANRSAMQRFLEAIHDTNNVTACNKDQAVVHAKGIPLLGSVDICNGGLCSLGSSPFPECDVFKIDNLAVFYLDSIIGTANLYFRPDILRNGILGIGASTVGIIEESSGIGYDSGNADMYNGADPTTPGFWDTSGSKTFRPKPGWLNRLVFFDLANDSPTSSGPNYTTNNFLSGLQGPHIGTQVCPERVIADPDPTAPDAAADGMIHGLRSCADGDWLFQRDQDTTFVWEDFGFYNAITPLVKAFANHQQETLFIALMEALDKHWADGQGTASECNLGFDSMGNPLSCSKDGVVTYEPLLVQLFSADFLPALQKLTQTLGTMTVQSCTAADASTGACSTVSPTSAYTVLSNAVRAAVDPNKAMAIGLTDREGNTYSVRNDGTHNAQVTPLYIILEALNGIDAQLTRYTTTNPSDADTMRMAEWKSARSQLVDQFLTVNGENTATATFADASVPKIVPVLLDLFRSQLWARCPMTFGGGTALCAWARTGITNEMSTVIGGPEFAGVTDLVDAMRQQVPARVQLEALLAYLVNAASTNDALASLLATTDDVVQAMNDDTNLVPIYNAVMSEALKPSLTDSKGEIVQKGMVDAQLALLARISGKSFDASGTEICSKELDPDQILQLALGKLVTPMTDATGNPTQTPLDVILDTIADVNRASPGQTTKLDGSDYGNISNEVSEFLLDPQRGLEQFYAIVRKGTVD